MNGGVVANARLLRSRRHGGKEGQPADGRPAVQGGSRLALLSDASVIHPHRDHLDISRGALQSCTAM